MKVKFFATYRPITKVTEMEVPEQEDVLNLLRYVIELFPELREKLLDSSGTDLAFDAIVLVNGRHIQHLDGVSTRLTNSDEVSLFPLVAGG